MKINFKSRLVANLCCITFAAFMGFANLAHANTGQLTQRIIEINKLFEAGKVDEAAKLSNKTLKNKKLLSAAAPALQMRAYLVNADLLLKQRQYPQQAATLEELLIQLDKWKATVSLQSVQIRNKLSDAYVQVGNEKKAIQVLEVAVLHAEKVFKADDLAHVELQLKLARLHTNRYEVEQATKYIASVKKRLQGNKSKAAELAKGRVLQAEGELYFRQAKTNDAAETYEKALAVRNRFAGEDSVETAQTVISLAGALKGLHDFGRAEELYRTAFAIYEGKLGIDHPFVATLLNNIGQMYYLQGRYADAEKVLERSLLIKSKHYPKDHLVFAETHNHLGYLYYLQEKNTEAEENLDAAIRIWSKPEYKRDRYRASAGVWRSVIKDRKGKTEEALKDLHSYLKVLEAIYGKDSVVTATAYQEIGHILEKQGKKGKAEEAYINGLKSAAVLGDGSRIEQILINKDLAGLQASDGRLKEGLDAARQSIKGMQQRVDRYSGAKAHRLSTELKSLREAAITHIDILASMREKEGVNKDELLEESFATSQISRASSVALALSRMAQRFAAKTGPLAELIKKQQHLLSRWQEIDNLLTTAIQKPVNKRDKNEVTLLRKSLKKTKTQIEKINSEINSRFPKYAALAKPGLVTIKQVQELLKPEEALVVYLIGKDKSFSWSLTKNKADLFRVKLGREKLSNEVRKLRRYMVAEGINSLDDIRPIKVKKSYKLYKTIMAEPLSIAGSTTSLIIVPDAALQSVPFSALVTKLPNKKIKSLEEHAQVAWLVKEKAVSVLPDVGSLHMLRAVLPSGENLGSNNFLGIGDPSLKEGAKTIALRSKENLATRGATTLRSIIGESRSAVDADVIGEMIELPDSADELRNISQLLKGSKKDIYLRNQATQSIISDLEMSKFKVVQFATHGLMSGEFQGLFEPALVLTPAVTNNFQDGDGLLTASEIAEMKMNADLVVLSACNTAASDGTPGAEGMSGLGRAFFYAGGRSLLLTHWSVLSDAAVSITTGMFDHMDKDDALSKAGALQKSKLDLIFSKDKPYYAHPLFWAPFVMVGEAGNRIN